MSYNSLRIGRISQPSHEYFITTVTVARKPLFTDIYLVRRFVSILKAVEREQDCHWFAWVLMPDHFHAMVGLGENGDLSRIVGGLKGRSAREINRCRGRRGTVWQPGFYDHALRAEEDRKMLARYIIANPVRAGLVMSVGEYAHWDCEWI